MDDLWRPTEIHSEEAEESVLIISPPPSGFCTTVFVEKLHPDACDLKRADPGAAGFDISALRKTVVPKGGRAAIDTGLKVKFGTGMFMQVLSRSGLALKHGIIVGGGVIDSSYRGEVKVILFNHGDKDVTFDAGDRVAQVVFQMIADTGVNIVYGPITDTTVRGTGGFGHSGIAALDRNITHAKTMEEFVYMITPVFDKGNLDAFLSYCKELVVGLPSKTMVISGPSNSGKSFLLLVVCSILQEKHCVMPLRDTKEHLRKMKNTHVYMKHLLERKLFVLHAECPKDISKLHESIKVLQSDEVTKDVPILVMLDRDEEFGGLTFEHKSIATKDMFYPDAPRPSYCEAKFWDEDVNARFAEALKHAE
jgi:dUTP pyrophosphatase